MNKIFGIYKIICDITNDFYIGGTTMRFGQRWSVHESYLKNGTHRNYLLQELYNKYGSNHIKYDIIEVIEDESIIYEREQFYMDTLKPTLNIFKYAGSSKGRKISIEHRKKIGEANKGRKLSEEHKEKTKNTQFKKGQKSWNNGIRISEDIRKNMSLAKKGKISNPDSLKKVEHNGIIFNSIAEASRITGVHKSAICDYCKGKRKNKDGLIFNYA